MGVDFEKIAENFQKFYRIRSISHCDMLDTDGALYLNLIEKTRYVEKDLLDERVYRNEVAEIVKKVWGSFAISTWYFRKNPERFSNKKFFVLRVKVKPGFERILSRLTRDIRRFKNGAFDEIVLDIERG